jgi:ParB/RepB/Spo0J family partition protein
MSEMILRERIRPNDWNANAFDPANYPKLVESIRTTGIMEPIKVMCDPEREGDFLLVDGYHRWKAAGDLDFQEVPCEVWDVSPEEAKVRGLQLNYLRGQPIPVRLANLVHDLNRTYAVDDLAKMLPWSESQLRDSLELLKLPADLQSKLEAQAAEEAAEAPVPVTIVLLGKEHDCFEAAMQLAKKRLGKGVRRGECLATICSHFVSGQASLEENAEMETTDDR